jgi:hypothetical protein
MPNQQNRPAPATNALPINNPGQTAPPPWTNSTSLGGEFVYVARTDEIFLRNGNRFRRPQQMPREQLARSTYNGPLPPPTQLPQYPFVNTGSPPSTNMQLRPGPPQAIAGAMANMNLNRQTQRITTESPVNVVFNLGGSQSSILRGDPPSNDAPSVRINKSELTGALFKTYKVRPRPREFFTIGRVFLVLWSEPAGGTSKVTAWEKGTVINHLGERVFSKVRRFVVIREGTNYCNALPINTYSGRGVSKNVVNKSEHVVIFTGSVAPLIAAAEMPKRGEAPMQLIPIQVDTDTPDEKLDPMSRLDLGGVTRVEHNIKVKSLGKVNKRSLDALRKQYANVQNSHGGAGPSAVPTQYALRSSAQGPAGDDGEEEEDEDEEEEDEEDEDEDEEDGDDEADNATAT